MNSIEFCQSSSYYYNALTKMSCQQIQSAVQDTTCVLRHYQSTTTEDRNHEFNNLLMCILDSFHTYVTDQDYFDRHVYTRWIIETVLNCPELSHDNFLQKMVTNAEITDTDFIAYYKTNLRLTSTKMMQKLLQSEYAGNAVLIAVQIPELNRYICEFIDEI